MDNAQSTVKTILTVDPIDFKLLIKSFRPKMNKAKNGIPIANKPNKAHNQIGALVESTILRYSVISLLPQKSMLPRVKNPITNPIMVDNEIIIIKIPISFANILKIATKTSPKLSKKLEAPVLILLPYLS